MSYITGRRFRNGGETYPLPPRIAAAGFDTTLYATQFGADPTGNADSTAALNAFLDATGKLKRRGRIPAGTYKVTGPLFSHDVAANSFYKGGLIEGDGRGITIIDYQGPKDTGEAILTWSRPDSEIKGLTFEGHYLASFGVAIQNGSKSRVGVDVSTMYQHGIIMPRTWAGLSGFNEECILDHVRVDSCGRPEIQTVSLRGSGLGGTFTLTLDGNTTAPIAWNATGTDVANALLAANPGFASPAVEDGGTGAIPFLTAGSLDVTLFITFIGFASGHYPTMTIDTTGITGTITLAQTALAQQGSIGHGIHFFEATDPEGNLENGTVAIFEPTTRANYGHGINLAGEGIKVWGGHFEGNYISGIRIGPLGPANFSTANMVHWPWLEGNVAAGMIDERAIRNWIALGVDFQNVFAESDGGDPWVTVDNAGLHVVKPGGHTLLLGTGPVARRISAIDKSGVTVPVQVNGLYDVLATTITLGADGPLTVVLTGALDAHTTHAINLNANATSFSIVGAESAMSIILHIKNIDGTKTIAWPAGYKWAGGTPPTLGTGGAGSTDIITLQYVGDFREISRSLGLP